MEPRLIMKSRQITLTLEKAKEWYNSGNADLREIALQAFTEKELTTENFKSVKTFYEACQTLGISISATDAVISTMENQIPNYTKASIAMYKLNIIRQALNKGHKMEFTKGTIYYPYIPFVTKENTCYNDRLRIGDVVEVAQFRVHGKEYTLLGGSALTGGFAGLGCFRSCDSLGHALAHVGFLGCATKEIAEHMSRYFVKEIFDAMYGDFVDYEWAGTNKID